MRNRNSVSEKPRYNNKNIIDMAEYVSHLSREFREAHETGRDSIFWVRNARPFSGRTLRDYMPVSKAIDEISLVSGMVISSKTESNIANAYLMDAAIVLSMTPVREDTRIIALMTLLPK